MSRSAIAIHTTPAAVITHTVATIRGQQLADLSVYHARTPDVRIALTWGGVLMHIWTCQAAQGLLESFSAAQAAMARVPLEIPSPANPCDEPFVRTTLAVEWTRRLTYAVVPQSGPSKIGGRTLHWVDLYTGPLTWRIRDHAGLRSTVELLREAHRTAIAVCLSSLCRDVRYVRGEPAALCGGRVITMCSPHVSAQARRADG